MQVFDPGSRIRIFVVVFTGYGVHVEEFEGPGLDWGKLRINHEGGVGLVGDRHGVVCDGGEVAEKRAEAMDRQSVIGAFGQGLAPGCC
jgi:hypothetical protein